MTVDTSEVLSRMLKLAHIPHEVLNAKNHAREAEIVSLAGQKGAVTIATNMAGRGTDIKLGPGVVELGGLHVLGSERHESRRIDRQLRGRCSRQGDPGSSQFFISLEDQLMRLFGSQKLSGIMLRLGMKEGEVMEHRWLNKSVETAQRRVEQQHYAIRKRTLEFDDVMNKQRSIVYELRGTILRGDAPTVHNTILDVMNDLVMTQAEKYLFDAKDGDLGAFSDWLGVTFPVTVTDEELKPLMGQAQAAGELVMKRIEAAYEAKCAAEDQQVLPFMERGVFLDAIDRQWQDYLRAMDDLRQSVNLRAYGQRDPLIEYKREAFHMFEQLMNAIKTEVVTGEFRAATARTVRRMFAAAQTNAEQFDAPNGEAEELRRPTARPAAASGAKPSGPVSAKEAFAALMGVAADRVHAAPPLGGAMPLPGMGGTPARPASTPHVGRNDPCPCGSGKKYKKCCGRNLF